MQATSAYLMDICGGRGSKDYVDKNRIMWMLLAVVRIMFTRVGRIVKSKESCFKLSILVNVLASLLFSLTVKESLKKNKRKKFKIKKASNPLSFIHFFSRSVNLMKFALFIVVLNFPVYNYNTLESYKRLNFNWRLSDTTNMMQIYNLCEVFLPFVSKVIYERLKSKKVIYLYFIATMLCDMNRIITPTKYSLYLNPLLLGLFDVSAAVNDQLASIQKDDDSVGEGELLANYENLTFPLGLILPSFYSEMYVMSVGQEGWSKGRHPLLFNFVYKALSVVFLLPYLLRKK